MSFLKVMGLLIFDRFYAVNVLVFFCWSFFWFLLKIMLPSLNWLNNLFWSIFWTLFSFLWLNFNSLFIFNNDRFVFLEKDVMKVFSDSSSLTYLYFVSWNCLRSWFLDSRWFLSWRAMINELCFKQFLFWLLMDHFWILRVNHLLKTWICNWNVSNTLLWNVVSTLFRKSLNQFLKLFLGSYLHSLNLWLFVMIFQCNIMINSWCVFTKTTHVLNLLYKLRIE